MACVLPAPRLIRSAGAAALRWRALLPLAARFRPAAAAAAASPARFSSQRRESGRQEGRASAATNPPTAAAATHAAPALVGHTQRLRSDKPLPLSCGGVLPELEIHYLDSLRFDPTAAAKPVVLLMPSMSHSAHATRSESDKQSRAGVAGWWDAVVGSGPGYGVDLRRFRLLCASPLGGPFGSTSPLSRDPRTGRAFRADFPVITPLDQARVYARLLDQLGVERVHAVMGASMGAMQAIQFAVHYPHRFERLVAICGTAQSSPSTQALRSVQRAVVRMDPCYAGGDYADAPAEAACAGPLAGMGAARMFGTICYRSREEFDARFSPRALPRPITVPGESLTISSSAQAPLFDVERYLLHQADSFTGRYDANCYLTLSQCMDLMDIAYTPPVHADAEMLQTPLSYEQACERIPKDKQIMLLPIASDALIPPAEMERLASVLGSQGKRVHVERIHSVFGHDAFLKEFSTFNPRLSEFLDPSVADGVDNVRKYVSSLFDS